MGGGCEPGLGPPYSHITDLSSGPDVHLELLPLTPCSKPQQPHWAVLPSSSPPPSCFLFLRVGMRHLLGGVHGPSLRRAPLGRISLPLAPCTACVPGRLPGLTWTPRSPVQSPGGGKQVAIDPSESGQCHGDGHDPRKVAQQLLSKGLRGHRREAARKAGWGLGRAGGRTRPHSPRPPR